MDTAERERLVQHIRSLDEDGVRKLLLEFFAFLHVRAEILHAAPEHGMDIVAYVEPQDDILGKGYNILVQAKKDKLTLDEWRKKVLYQLLELPYYSIHNANYIDELSRRILLVVSNEVTPEAAHSITEFNVKHEVTIEYWTINDMLLQFDRGDFASQLLALIPQTVGGGTQKAIKLPTVGNRITKRSPGKQSKSPHRLTNVRRRQRPNRH